jgi:DNA polymerase delta subunit 3
MLYEYHRVQNGRKSGSVHATYLVSGFRALAVPQKPEASSMETDGKSSFMSSDMFPSSIPNGNLNEPGPSHRLVTLVEEEKLEG